MADTPLRERHRPLILIPSRFSDTASALRYRAEVGARALVEAIFQAGGEPLLMHPHAPAGRADLGDVRDRLAIADAILLPGGGDLDSSWSGQHPHSSQYDVDLEQDAFDLAVARVALECDLPLLAVCRGAQAVNVALGGDTVQDMDERGGHHRHHVHDIAIEADSLLAGACGPRVIASCYHHQCIDRLGAGLSATARAEDGVIEAIEIPGRGAWFLGTQWHPEDTAATDAAQAALFSAFVSAAAHRPRSRRAFAQSSRPL
ncbi:MAG TPA: gamma-glutamyl-gamma-aminobutyrate hydrolase family protein [Actinocrinis sp.]|nr:gamma-glutamyl-gamma-aminobutyrate hydrolase family protein [Actinocrinis sp.]